SDVLSLAVNPSNPAQVFASACSGIYRSDDAGAHWKRAQGIPEASRRTLVIRFDPDNRNTLFAGTTTGLWDSEDGGWRSQRISPADWVINTLVVSAASGEGSVPHLLIGTEQQGVLAGTGFSGEFEAINEGFGHRRIVSLTLDRANPERLGAVLANSSEPVVQTRDAGATWSPLGSGIEPSAVKRLFSMPDGWWASATSGGLLRLDAAGGRWIREGVLADSADTRTASSRKGAVRTVKTTFRAQVNDLTFSDSEFFAATEEGLFRSGDAGKSWSPVSFSAVA